MSTSRQLTLARQDLHDATQHLLRDGVIASDPMASTVTITEDAFRGLHESYAALQLLLYDLDGDAAASARDTSIAAAADALPSASTLRRDVLWAFAGRNSMIPGDGLTCQAVENLLGREHTSVSSAVNYLENRHLIKDSRLRRLTRSGRKAIVYVITDDATQLLREDD